MIVLHQLELDQNGMRCFSKVEMGEAQANLRVGITNELPLNDNEQLGFPNSPLPNFKLSQNNLMQLFLHFAF